MRYVVVDTNTWQTLNAHSYDKIGSAKRSATCANKRSKKGWGDRNWVVMPIDEWRKGDTLVEVTSLMGGKCYVRRSQVGTCVDPSTERYWAM